jgi:diguanylate cyclase (GGDEF)-like protein
MLNGQNLRSQTAAQLYEMLTPTAVMVGASAAAGFAVALRNPSQVNWILFAGLAGTGAARILGLLWVKRAMTAQGDDTLQERFVHAAYLAFAAALGCFAGHSLYAESPDSHLLAATLVSSYCAGTLLLTGWRSQLVNQAMVLAVAPSVIALLLVDDIFYRLAGAFLLVTLASGMRAISTLQRYLTREIGSRVMFQRMAYLDPLTGVANRRGAANWLRDLQKQAPGTVVAIHSFDLNSFKQVNDAYGHQAGDKLLCVVADRLREAVRGKDFVARWGGDEFLVLQPDMATQQQAEMTAARLSKLLSLPVEIGGNTVSISTSVGSSLLKLGSEDFEHVLMRADQNLYDQKARVAAMAHT